MIEGGKAAAIIVIASFVVFIVWAKTAAGRAALRSAFGEPSSTKSIPRKGATAPRKKPTQKSPQRKRSGP
jgi:hypothetical protein